MRHPCRDILPSDLQYLTDENIEEIGSTMTHVERMRMQAALQAMRGAYLLPHRANAGLWILEDRFDSIVVRS